VQGRLCQQELRLRLSIAGEATLRGRSKGCLVYRAFSTSITNATLPSGLRNGNGLPVYLSEIGSMYLQSPSGQQFVGRELDDLAVRAAHHAIRQRMVDALQALVISGRLLMCFADHGFYQSVRDVNPRDVQQSLKLPFLLGDRSCVFPVDVRTGCFADLGYFFSQFLDTLIG